MEALFSTEDFSSIAGQDSLLPKCSSCLLYKHCISPKMPVSGKGKRKILLVGEAPGKTEDREGIQFCGKTGYRLERALDEVGIDMRRDCWITNAVICRPTKPSGANRTPTSKELDYCRPNLHKTLRELKPEIILTVGQPALSSVLHGIWREKLGTMTKWLGWQIPCQKLNAWICPTWHPSFVEKQQEKNDFKVVQKIWLKHLKKVSTLEGRPWKKVPDFHSKTKLIYDPDEAADYIDTWIKQKPDALAFDYETTTRKPHSKHAEIYSCSLSDGKIAIAFPWAGRAIQAMVKFLQSDIPKIASNIAFEDSWSRIVLGVKVRAWKWCTVHGEHWLDSRTGICGLKFLALVLLGFSVYDEGIKPYLKSTKPGGNQPNKIRECELGEILHYNALDSLLAYKVAEKQMKEGNYEQE